MDQAVNHPFRKDKAAAIQREIDMVSQGSI